VTIDKMMIIFFKDNLYNDFFFLFSAGIGRTGCFIALSNGIKQLDNERIIDIVRILCDLRRDRGGMIQTNDQYQFVYQAFSEYARTLQLSS
jgi:receptor-type tyrosine-protein phosphatase R